MILSQICNIYDGTHQTPKYVDEGVPFYSVEHVSKDDFSNTKFITEEVFTKECQRVSIEQGDILMTRIGSVGVPKFIDWNVRASFYVSLALLKPKTEGINMGWLSYYIQSPNIQRDIWRLTIHVAFPKKINLGDIGKIRIKLPPKAEQESNYVLLKSVDQKINLLTKKKEALETYKKGLMQKIFSQELRFKREDGTDYPEWEIETLDKLCSKCKSGGTPKSTIAEYYNGNIPFLAISDITEQGKYLRSTSKSISELGIENSASWIVPKQSLIYSMYASVGFVSINLIPLATSQAVLNLIVDEKICLTEYLYYWLYQFQKNVHIYVTTGTQGNLNAQTVKSFQVDLPSIKEQEKITLTLSKIDEQISFMSTQIENTVTLKKGLLQQMFV